MKVLESIPDNPVGIQFRRIGDSAIALMARHFPAPHFSHLPDPGGRPIAEHGADIERVAGAETMEGFLDAYIAGWQLSVDIDGFKCNVRPWLHQPGWSLFLARVDGKPAATGLLFVEDGVGYLADASCDPIYRRRGLHVALLARRIGECTTAGTEFICSGATFLSTSHRNMERAGLRIQFNRSIWTERT